MPCEGRLHGRPQNEFNRVPAVKAMDTAATEEHDLRLLEPHCSSDSLWTQQLLTLSGRRQEHGVRRHPDIPAAQALGSCLATAKKNVPPRKITRPKVAPSGLLQHVPCTKSGQPGAPPGECCFSANGIPLS